jgi:hypothetical protein
MRSIHGLMYDLIGFDCPGCGAEILGRRAERLPVRRWADDQSIRPSFLGGNLGRCPKGEAIIQVFDRLADIINRRMTDRGTCQHCMYGRFPDDQILLFVTCRRYPPRQGPGQDTAIFPSVGRSGLRRVHRIDLLTRKGGRHG